MDLDQLERCGKQGHREQLGWLLGVEATTLGTAGVVWEVVGEGATQDSKGLFILVMSSTWIRDQNSWLILHDWNAFVSCQRPRDFFYSTKIPKTFIEKWFLKKILIFSMRCKLLLLLQNVLRLFRFPFVDPLSFSLLVCFWVFLKVLVRFWLFLQVPVCLTFS